jgi:hypothetical protein
MFYFHWMQSFRDLALAGPDNWVLLASARFPGRHVYQQAAGHST